MEINSCEGIFPHLRFGFFHNLNSSQHQYNFSAETFIFNLFFLKGIPFSSKQSPVPVSHSDTDFSIFKWVFSWPIYSSDFAKWINHSYPLLTTGIITTIITHYNLSCCCLIFFSCEIISFLIGIFWRTASNCFFNHCCNAICYSLHWYKHCRIFFDALLPLLFCSDYWDFDDPLFLAFLLSLFYIFFGFDTLRLYCRNFDVISSPSFNRLYLTFSLPDLFLL